MNTAERVRIRLQKLGARQRLRLSKLPVNLLRLRRRVPRLRELSLEPVHLCQAEEPDRSSFPIADLLRSRQGR